MKRKEKNISKTERGRHERTSNDKMDEVENDKMNHALFIIDRSLVIIYICNKHMRARMQVVIGG